jgi:transmembrane sensor
LKQFYNHINDDLLVKYLTREITTEEEKVLNTWLSESADNRKYFDHFKLIWENSLSLAARSTIDENEAWKRFRQRTEKNSRATVVQFTQKNKTNYSWLKIAVAILFAFAGSFITYQYFFKTKPVQTLQLATIEQVLIDTLPDASVVTLNKHSRLYYPSRFNKDGRAVKLEGEAFFNITPNKQAPFTISVNDVTVKVVGTSFNVRSFQGKTEVIVETGIVQIIKDSKIMELKPGERTIATRDDSLFAKKPVTDQLYNYYRSKKFVCDNTSLERLIEMLNEAYDAHIVIENNDLRNLSLTTTFNNEPLDRILEIIAETFNISVVKKDSLIVLKQKD